MRDICLELLVFCESVPSAIFGWVRKVSVLGIDGAKEEVIRTFERFIKEDSEARDFNLRRFRPNLENPANIAQLTELNEHEEERS